jgi:hypothetical protein
VSELSYAQSEDRPPSQATVTVSGKVQETPCSQGSKLRTDFQGPTFKDRHKDRRKKRPTLASMQRLCPRPALASIRRSCRPTNQNEDRPVKPRPTLALMRLVFVAGVRLVAVLCPRKQNHAVRAGCIIHEKVRAPHIRGEMRSSLRVCA